MFGIDRDRGLESATDDSLRKLLNSIGRNGETDEGKRISSKIEHILNERKEAGVSIENHGFVAHSV